MMLAKYSIKFMHVTGRPRVSNADSALQRDTALSQGVLAVWRIVRAVRDMSDMFDWESLVIII